MTTTWGEILGRKYEESSAILEWALKDCPDALWGASVWEVRRNDPWVWPIKRGVGSELPDEERLQLHSAFWNVAYHAIFFLDFDLSERMAPFEPPPPFREDDHEGNVLPVRVYTKAELLGYLDYGRARARAVLDVLTEERATRPGGAGGVPFAERLIGSLLHVRGHTEHLNLFLSLKGVARTDPGARALRDAVRGASDEKIAAFAAQVGGYPGLLSLVFQGLAARIEPRQDVAVGFAFEGVGQWTLRVVDGKAVSAAGADGVEATLRMTPPDFLRVVTGDAPAEKLSKSFDGEPAALDRLFDQMPEGHPLRAWRAS